ncbi:MAG TPA: cobalt-precorrin-5B (C(1))-methyltransferase [Methanothrix sp.]|nr:cobalt-precorrin-5B (C(1))-methyltransferase [Methanothrix sp.]HOK58802.1 cobalt-precorrin-5B (C(1))-methyltransferase [Methanothrix sp.]HOL43956.1 cobalt-precorrin-5B (C(1))-methyltransferase [Methanothrix sp.]HPO88994.1 cobalt-precorrin-5B (C(1))-methyltransferase [Methanothrix sp.]
MIDPVTGFRIPDEWLKRSSLEDIDELIESGLWVLLSNGQVLRRGLTTGTTASAACKGAVLSLMKDVDEVDVWTPAGIRVRVRVEASGGRCAARKDAGDHSSDITHGMNIIASASPSERSELVAGEGIGRIGRVGLSANIGRPAISRSAHAQIIKAIEEGVAEAGLSGAVVHLSVPDGRRIALRTLNPSVGVEGGISILGSTGFVEPWNEHLEYSLSESLSEPERVVATTGRTGLRYSRILFPDHTAVLIGSKLDMLRMRTGRETVLCGLPGLILRWAEPEMLDGTGYATVAEMIEREPDHPAIARALEHLGRMLPGTRIVLIKRDGSIYRDTGLI